MYTEEEAKQKWCPMIRNAVVESSGYDGAFQGVATTNTGGGSRCITLACMMWRWSKDDNGETKIKRISHDVKCSECDGDGCDDCDHEGKTSQFVQIGCCGLGGEE